MSISVIIPALNEAAVIAGSIRSAQADDVILADGGSRDGTVQIAKTLGARIIVQPGGRGAQQNAGAAAARHDVLLFLHADTRLPSTWQEQVKRGLADPGVAIGAFSLGIEGAGRGERFVAAGANVRSRRLGLPYGDQALFMRRSTFEKLGGFRPLPIMEDYDLVRRARSFGRILTLDAAVSTSARRWRQAGWVRAIFINQLMLAGWHLGVAPERLARFYRKRARR